MHAHDNQFWGFLGFRSILKKDFATPKSVFGFRVLLGNPNSGFPNRTQPKIILLRHHDKHSVNRFVALILFSSLGLFPSREDDLLSCFHLQINKISQCRKHSFGKKCYNV